MSQNSLNSDIPLLSKYFPHFAQSILNDPKRNQIIARFKTLDEFDMPYLQKFQSYATFSMGIILISTNKDMMICDAERRGYQRRIQEEIELSRQRQLRFKLW